MKSPASSTKLENITVSRDCPAVPERRNDWRSVPGARGRDEEFELPVA